NPYATAESPCPFAYGRRRGSAVDDAGVWAAVLLAIVQARGIPGAGAASAATNDRNYAQAWKHLRSQRTDAGDECAGEVGVRGTLRNCRRGPGGALALGSAGSAPGCTGGSPGIVALVCVDFAETAAGESGSDRRAKPEGDLFSGRESEVLSEAG